MKLKRKRKKAPSPMSDVTIMKLVGELEHVVTRQPAFARDELAVSECHRLGWMLRNIYGRWSPTLAGFDFLSDLKADLGETPLSPRLRP